MAGEIDVQELFGQLRQRPEQLAQLRALILGDLDLPAALTALAQAGTRTEERLAALTERVDALTHQVDALTHQVDTLTQRVDTLTQRVDTLTEAVGTLGRRVDALVSQVSALTSQVTVLTGHVQDLRADAMERRYRERGHIYLRAIAQKLRPLDAVALDDLLDTAVEQGRLAEDDAESVRLADAILRGRRRIDGVLIHLVVEASLGVGMDDVHRARDRADLLIGAGIPAEAVVAGTWVIPDAVEAAHALGVWQVTNGRSVPPDEPVAA